MQISLGQRIREIRMKKGLTQTQLAQGISTPSMVSQVESDRARPSYRILAKFAERLDVSLDLLLTDVEMNLQLTSTYRMARAMVSSKDYEAAIPLLKELQHAPAAVCSQHDVLFALVECYMHTGQCDQAEPYMKQLQQRAQVLLDHQTIVRIGFLFGLLEYDRKQYHLAVHEWLKTAEALDEMHEPDVLLKRQLFSQLGEAYRKIGMVQEAIDSFERAAIISQGTGNMQGLGETYKQLAESFMRIKQWDRVAYYAQKAEAIYETLEHISMKWMLQVNCAVAYAQSGRHEEAVGLLEQAIEWFQEMGNRKETGIALVELAKVCLQFGDIDRAEGVCLTARAILPELHVYQAWVHRVLGRVANERGQEDVAIRNFEKAADCFKNMEEFGEWEATMFDLSHLYQEQQNSERAFRVLESLRNFTQKVLVERGSYCE